MVYLNEEAELRDEKSLRNRCQNKHHNGTSGLERLVRVNMVFDFILEYMISMLMRQEQGDLNWIQVPFEMRISQSKITRI